MQRTVPDHHKKPSQFLNCKCPHCMCQGMEARGRCLGFLPFSRVGAENPSVSECMSHPRSWKKCRLDPQRKKSVPQECSHPAQGWTNQWSWLFKWGQTEAKGMHGFSQVRISFCVGKLIIFGWREGRKAAKVTWWPVFLCMACSVRVLRKEEPMVVTQLHLPDFVAEFMVILHPDTIKHCWMEMLGWLLIPLYYSE